MKRIKKALSLLLCFAMVITNMHFAVKADAAASSMEETSILFCNRIFHRNYFEWKIPRTESWNNNDYSNCNTI